VSPNLAQFSAQGAAFSQRQWEVAKQDGCSPCAAGARAALPTWPPRDATAYTYPMLANPEEVAGLDTASYGAPYAPSAAEQAAAASEGNLTRARVLVTDTGLLARRQAFAAVPRRIDGTGTTVVALCNELAGLIEAAAKPLEARQADEVTALEARVAAAGERGSGRKQLEERHKRELRRHRTDELRSGLSVMAGVYRDALVAGNLPRPDGAVQAVRRIHQALEALDRNPNETLLLQALLLELPSL